MKNLKTSKPFWSTKKVHKVVVREKAHKIKLCTFSNVALFMSILLLIIIMWTYFSVGASSTSSLEDNEEAEDIFLKIIFIKYIKVSV